MIFDISDMFLSYLAGSVTILLCIIINEKIKTTGGETVSCEKCNKYFSGLGCLGCKRSCQDLYVERFTKIEYARASQKNRLRIGDALSLAGKCITCEHFDFANTQYSEVCYSCARYYPDLYEEENK